MSFKKPKTKKNKEEKRDTDLSLKEEDSYNEDNKQYEDFFSDDDDIDIANLTTNKIDKTLKDNNKKKLIVVLEHA